MTADHWLMGVQVFLRNLPWSEMACILLLNLTANAVLYHYFGRWISFYYFALSLAHAERYFECPSLPRSVREEHGRHRVVQNDPILPKRNHDDRVATQEVRQIEPQDIFPKSQVQNSHLLKTIFHATGAKSGRYFPLKFFFYYISSVSWSGANP